MSAFGSSNKPDWYTSSKEPRSSPGRTKGLSLILDAHSDKLASGSVDGDFQGFTGLIHSSESFPLVSEYGFQIRPGSNNLVAMSAVKIEANQNIRRILPIERNCLFPDENEGLKIYKSYKQSNCQLECLLSLAQQALLREENETSRACTPWYFPFQDGTSRYCDPWQAKRFRDLMSSVEKENSCKHCLPDCQKTIYNPKVSTLPFKMCDETNLGLSPLCNFVSTGFATCSRIKVFKQLTRIQNSASNNNKNKLGEMSQQKSSFSLQHYRQRKKER